ncbi:hypothetical protein ACX1C1_10725 [Paenibacillus sp. strain BS8-2]
MSDKAAAVNGMQIVIEPQSNCGGTMGMPQLVRVEKVTAVVLGESTGEWHRLAFVVTGEGQFYDGFSSRAFRPGSIFLLAPHRESEFHETRGTAEIIGF